MGVHLLSSIIPATLSGAILTLPVLIIGYQLWICIYNIFFHPLRKFPGPILCKISPLPLIIHNFRGDSIQWTIKLHEQYGECVRVTPAELSFNGADAYKDIYFHKKAGRATLDKDDRFYLGPDTHVRDIVNADAENHTRMRRIFANAFSDRALKLQEPMFLTYINKLIEKVQEGFEKDAGRKYNMVQMYNFTTFDIMGDLTFGESLGMLDDTSYHPWVAALVASFKFGVYIHSMRYFPALEAILMKYCIPDSLRERMRLHNEFSVQRVNRRLEKQDARPDIWGLVLEKDDEKGMTRQEMYQNANLFMIAGTETTATLLSGVTWHLLASPEKFQRLVNEIRDSIKTEDDITIQTLQALPYLHACLEEGLRMYPPVAQALPRITPPGPPTTIDGREVPAGSTVYVANLAAFRNPNNFVDPWRFIPERWLTDTPEGAPYLNEKKHAFQPFSLGPRGCLGKNMAYHEMRLILTKLLWHFDVSLCEESRHWNEQKIFIMWDKAPLMVQLRPRQK